MNGSFPQEQNTENRDVRPEDKAVVHSCGNDVFFVPEPLLLLCFKINWPLATNFSSVGHPYIPSNWILPIFHLFEARFSQQEGMIEYKYLCQHHQHHGNVSEVAGFFPRRFSSPVSLVCWENSYMCHM